MARKRSRSSLRDSSSPLQRIPQSSDFDIVAFEDEYLFRTINQSDIWLNMENNKPNDACTNSNMDLPPLSLEGTSTNAADISETYPVCFEESNFDFSSLESLFGENEQSLLTMTNDNVSGCGKEFKISNPERFETPPCLTLDDLQTPWIDNSACAISSASDFQIPCLNSTNNTSADLNTGSQIVLVPTTQLQNIGVQNIGVQNIGVQNIGVQNIGVQNTGIQNIGVQNFHLLWQIADLSSTFLNDYTIQSSENSNNLFVKLDPSDENIKESSVVSSMPSTNTTQGMTDTIQGMTSTNKDSLSAFQEMSTGPGMKRKLNVIKIEDSDDSLEDNNDFNDNDSDDDNFPGDDHPESRADMLVFIEEFLACSSKKQKPYFFQYNFQSRGPKGARLFTAIELKDCHKIDDYVDPVSYSYAGEKIRKGEGNDPRPNARKLLEIGCKISGLEKEFKSLSVTSGGVKGKALNKGKNQLASRICRLKKKAQHESNKIILEGLRKEHQKLMSVVTGIANLFLHRQSISDMLSNSLAASVPSTKELLPQLCEGLDSLIKQHLKFKIAGNSIDYVVLELEKIAKDILGGS